MRSISFSPIFFSKKIDIFKAHFLSPAWQLHRGIARPESGLAIHQLWERWALVHVEK
jgi:hypothetical protein